MTQRMITAAGIVLIAGITLLSPYLFALVWISMSIWIICIEWPRLAPWYTSLLYPAPVLVYVVWLYIYQQQAYIVWYGIASAMIFDTSAYYIGQYHGRHAITHISPGKTWQGTIGGYITMSLAIIGVSLYHHTPDTYIHAIVASTSLSIASFFGDIGISWLKRQHDRKNCGNLLPGHGGALDRVDSILLTIPIAHLLATWNYI